MRANDAAGNLSGYSNIASASTLAAADTIAPTVSAFSTTPAGPTYTTAQTVTLNATASDNIGVARVDFYDGTALLASDTSAPYSFAWAITGANNGAHSLTARAVDAAGNVGTSSALSRTVNIGAAGDTTPPTVSAFSTTPAGPPYTTAQTIALTIMVAGTTPEDERDLGAEGGG